MAGPADRRSSAGSLRTPARLAAGAAPSPGSLRQRLSDLATAQSDHPRQARSRRGGDPTIDSLSDWIEEINRQPAVYDTGIRMTSPDVWPPTPDGAPRGGIAPWKLARRRELASRFGPLLAVGVLGALYLGYDTVLSHNQSAFLAGGEALTLRAPPLVAARSNPPQADERPPFRVTLGPLSAGRPAPVSITATGAAIAGETTFIFKGLPPGAILSAGAAASTGWAVPPADLAGLNLTPPPRSSGDLGFKVALVRDGSTIVHEEAYSLPVADAVSSTTLEPRPASGAASAPHVVAGEEKLLARATAMIDANDIAGARLVYQHLAIQGSAAGALALARSYDPAFLAQRRSVGVQADVEKARHWYGRAAEFGSPQAHAALQGR